MARRMPVERTHGVGCALGLLLDMRLPSGPTLSRRTTTWHSPASASSHRCRILQCVQAAHRLIRLVALLPDRSGTSQTALMHHSCSVADISRPITHCSPQESSIYAPAAGVLAAAGAVPLQQYCSPAKQGQPIYELRQYQVGAWQPCS